jgi:hypothetical protein
MYGLLAGCQNGLGVEARKAWRRHLCGLCESLSRGFGPPARLLATPDAAFLSLLVEAQAPRVVTAASPSRCLLRRPFYLHVPSTSSVASRFARSIAVCAASTRMEDALHDGDVRPNWLARVLAAVVAPLARRAWRELAELGFDTLALVRAQGETAVAEASLRDFDALAAPTQAAYATVLEHTSVLAGRDDGRRAARELGRRFGRLAYVADARADLVRDFARRRFNALAACFGKAAIREGASLADAAVQEVRAALTSLRLARHRELIAQLLTTGLARKMAWVCGGSQGGKRIRIPKPKKPDARPKEPLWKGWGCTGAWDKDDADEAVKCCVCGEPCCEWCCLLTLCCCRTG